MEVPPTWQETLSLSLTPLRVPGVGHGVLNPYLAPLHTVKTIRAAPETNGMGSPEGQSQEAQLRKEVAALREQLEHACSQG